jgi:hemerythrin-like metal-binding protein
MDFFTWTDDFLTGIDIVDRQHCRLVELINTAAPILTTDTSEQVAERQALFFGLTDYTSEHFRTEEELMRAQGLEPRAFEHHRQTHARLLQDVLDWQERLASGDALAGQEFLGFLASWLMFHVLGEDLAMARQIHAIQSGLTPVQAYDAAAGTRLSPSEPVLARTVTEIYTKLSGQLHQTENYGKHLEQEVKARTEELASMAEELRRARDAAEAATQAKSRFLGMVSHELRTPMNVIVGLTSVLRSTELSSQQITLADRTLTAAEHLDGLIDGLIEFTGNGSGQSGPFDLRAMMGEACRAPFAAARAKGLQTDLEIGIDLPLFLHGDMRRIIVVIRQLAANAAKFTAQGSIQVRAERLGLESDGHIKLRISVTDTGIGIAADKQAGLFEAFHQLDDSPTRRYGGVGLGLALTRQTAQLIGAEIGMHSEPGKGSRFWLDLRLPATTAPHGTQTVLPGAQSNQQSDQFRTSSPEAQTTRAEGRDILRQLEKLLSEDDTRATDVFSEHKAYLRQLFGERFVTLDQQIADFEYHRALASLRAWQDCG